MLNKKVSYLSFLIIIIFLYSPDLTAQDTTKSLAFKKNRPVRNNPYFYQPDLSYQLLQQFKLVQIANSGDPLAQHELGLRLLTGEGIAADTITAVYWIKKAASQKLSSAQYNYGIMLVNGWGTEWNPFSAYDNFLSAAESGMSQAQYVIGIFNTDNLVIPRNWNKAYYWIKKSVDGGYEPAKDALNEIAPKVSLTFRDSVDENKFTLTDNNSDTINETDPNIQPTLGLVFIDFNIQSDSVQEITDKILITELNNLNIPLSDSLSNKNDSSLSIFYSESKINYLRKLSESGSHEAQTILGKLYEQGNFVGKNKLLAAEYYIRATILDSPRAAFLLWQLIRQKDFYNLLNDAVQFSDPTAQFVWYGLKSLGYDNRLTDKDAIVLLEKAAAQNHIASLIELGYNYYVGKYVMLDKQKGLDYFKKAENFNYGEGSVRLAASKVFESNSAITLDEEISILMKAEINGSILAQFTLAHCYENGIGVKKNLPNAVKYYRAAAQRGNQFAYEQLKRLYDSLRPKTETFNVQKN
ncbi:MAG: tetratricopeptide repeat protein [Ignavibacteriaceae bacterium]